MKPIFRRGLAALLIVAGIAGLSGNLRAADTDTALTDNPALSALSHIKPEEAQAMIADIHRELDAASTPGMRHGPVLDPWSEQTLDHNPLLNQLYAHDPAAALDMLRRIKEAGAR